MSDLGDCVLAKETSYTLVGLDNRAKALCGEVCGLKEKQRRPEELGSAEHEDQELGPGS